MDYTNSYDPTMLKDNTPETLLDFFETEVCDGDYVIDPNPEKPRVIALKNVSKYLKWIRDYEQADLETASDLTITFHNQLWKSK